MDGYIEHFRWNYPVNATVGLRNWWYVNIGSGDGSVQAGNKSSPEPMLTQTFVPTWYHFATLR